VSTDRRLDHVGEDMHILLVSADSETFAEMAAALGNRPDVRLSRAGSGAQALALASGASGPEVLVVDERLGDMTGLDFARKLVAQNPMIYCAVVSGLPEADFHEASEGLGLLAQLPVHPTAADAAMLRDRLEAISRLAAPKKH
jgi:CheY-like chemotaxis protein